jgi:hypothetical protein
MARATASLTPDFLVEEVIVRGSPFRLRELSIGDYDELVRKAAEKKAKDDAKKGGATLQAVDAPAEPVEEEFVPEARERRGAEPTAASVFGSRD